MARAEPEKELIAYVGVHTVVAGASPHQLERYTHSSLLLSPDPSKGKALVTITMTLFLDFAGFGQPLLVACNQ